ncbi:hypothetical protein GCM10028807_29010 [Spirosoma daeguense]
MKEHVELRVDSIRDIEFFLSNTLDVDPEKLGIKIEGKDMVAYGDTKTVAITTEVRYVHNYESTNPQEVLKYINEMVFYIDNFNEIFRLENTKYVFSKNLARFLLDIITPTIRGILFAKTSGTSLAKYYLPIIQADKIINWDSESA